MSCKLLDGIFPLLVQIALGMVCLIVLFYKRYNEYPQRPYIIWLLDTIKQGISAIVGHFISMLYSIIFTYNSGNECAMYLLVFIIDNFTGLLFAYYGLKCLNNYAIENKKDDLISGNYGTPVSYKIWGLQTTIWAGIVLISRLMCGLIIYILQDILTPLSSSIYKPFDSVPDLFLVLVMIVCPLIINIFVMWIQDNFLKSNKPYWYIMDETEYRNIEY
jgi:hypothetical protein